jgi:hypothetical protein
MRTVIFEVVSVMHACGGADAGASDFPLVASTYLVLLGPPYLKRNRATPLFRLSVNAYLNMLGPFRPCTRALRDAVLGGHCVMK